MPKPLLAAAIVPAVCVPWPLSSCAEVPATGAPLRQLTLSATSMFAARSGCVKSIPVSMSPTSTDGLPPVIACACGVLIWRMSHCNPESESASVAGVLGTAPGFAPVSSTWVFGSWYANPAVDEAPSMRLSLSRLSRNDSLSERAITTPICG